MGRMERVNQQLKREVGMIIQRDMSDPRVEFITITAADVSPDLRNAKVYFSVLGMDGHEGAQVALENAQGMIRRLVSKRMNLRHTPEMTFHFDNTIENSSRIEETLKEINNDIQENNSDN